jgi:hypothetical protein
VASDVDTTVVVRSPDGDWFCNDDTENLTDNNPGIVFESPVSGQYNIWVGTYYESISSDLTVLAITEYSADEWGSFDLLPGSTEKLATLDGIDFGDDTGTWPNDDECDDSRFEGDGMAFTLYENNIFHDANDCQTLYSSGAIQLIPEPEAVVASIGLQQGSLSSTDATRDNDSYVDRYTFEGVEGSSAVIDLRSSAFDTLLIVRSPSGTETENDDFENDQTRSLLSLSLEESGTYEVLATSYWANDTGNYTLDIQTDSGIATSSDQQFTGDLAAGDNTFTSGEYFDTYTFAGRPGQRLTIDLTSTEIDTYLILNSPNGETEHNDAVGESSDAQIVTELSELGTYELIATSYGPAETGAYNLTITEAELISGQANSNRDMIGITIGDTIEGGLQIGDSLSSNERYEDSYVFEAEAGDTVSIEMLSSPVDTFLRLITPSNEEIENDDYNDSRDQSLIELTLQESGRYRIIATSYSSSETGPYELSLRSGGAAITNNIVSSAGAEIYGIFAGIADYEGEDSDLPLTDQDAERARDALIRGAGMNPNNGYTLLNSDATLANFSNALNEIAAVADSEDTLVIFYSGHGGRLERETGPDSRDPDGYDETMVLYDYHLRDDELANMLDQVSIGKVLLVMDACFSGGFSKDIVSVPGRMGLFSSEEDVLSQVAVKFQAGGFLSVFFEEALTERYADRDENGELTAIELSQYLHDRFRADVKSGAFGTDEYVRASGPQANYQQLVVDRGGVGPYNVLFTRQ